MPDYTHLFTKEFLSDRLTSFELSSVVNISVIRRTIKNLNESLQSGKLDYMKEESIKSRFLMELFGDVLGFNYKNSEKWLFQEEVKTEVDGTKPDGALGLFYITENGIKKDVRVVIEVKNTNTDLDDIQKDRTTKITPVDQAMLYATKMGEGCRWVIVTNIREVRFYRANDQTRYQRFLLSELLKEDHLRELLFLFQRENFYTGQESSTDGLLRQTKKKNYDVPDSSHIIDQLYYSLKKFDQLHFVDPKLIANMKPFNVLDEHVWHYSEGHLFTLNPEIYRLLKAISIEKKSVIIETDYQTQLQQADVVEYARKIDYIIEKLYVSHVQRFSALSDLDAEKIKNKRTLGFSYRHMMHLSADNSVTLNLKVPIKEDCDCLACTYQSLDFVRLIKKIEQLEETEANTMEVAYGHYLLCTDNFKKSYRVYKAIEREAKGDEKRILEYFCVKYNIKQLHNLFFTDNEYSVMRKDARSIDLDRVISDELDIFSDKDLRKAMVEIKEDKIFVEAVKRSDELVREIKTVRSFTARGGTYTALPNYVNQLYHEFGQVFGHIQKNFLVYDKFSDYKSFNSTVFRGLLTSSRTTKYGLKNISLFIITEAILHVKPKELQEMLKPVKKLKLDEKDRVELLARAATFFTSYASKGIFGDPYTNGIIEKQLLNSLFRDKYTDIFNNLCTVLAYVEFDKNEFSNVAAAVITFVKVDGTLAWWDIAQLGKIIEDKGALFDSRQLIDLLVFALDSHRVHTTKYEDLIRRLCYGLRKFHPDQHFDNAHMAKRAILNCQSENGLHDLKPLSALWHISSDEVKSLLSIAFEEQLDREFNSTLYEHLLKGGVISFDRKDYLFKLAEVINRVKGPGFTGFENGNPDFSDFYNFNFLVIPYILDLDFDLPEFHLLTGLSAFETWLQNPFTFDYLSFDARWLIVTNNAHIFKRLKGFEPIKERLAQFLKSSYDKQLAKIYFDYFA